MGRPSLQLAEITRGSHTSRDEIITSLRCELPIFLFKKAKDME